MRYVMLGFRHGVLAWHHADYIPGSEKMEDHYQKLYEAARFKARLHSGADVVYIHAINERDRLRYKPEGPLIFGREVVDEDSGIRKISKVQEVQL